MSRAPLSWIADKLDLTPRLSADYPFLFRNPQRSIEQ